MEMPTSLITSQQSMKIHQVHLGHVLFLEEDAVVRNKPEFDPVEEIISDE